jgi:hypothetical protein
MWHSKYVYVEHVTLANSLQNGHAVTLLFAPSDVRIYASCVASHQDEVPWFVLQMGWKTS